MHVANCADNSLERSPNKPPEQSQEFSKSPEQLQGINSHSSIVEATPVAHDLSLSNFSLPRRTATIPKENSQPTIKLRNSNSVLYKEMLDTLPFNESTTQPDVPMKENKHSNKLQNRTVNKRPVITTNEKHLENFVCSRYQKLLQIIKWKKHSCNERFNDATH